MMWLLFGLIIKLAPCFRALDAAASWLLSAFLLVLVKDGETEDNLEDEVDDDSDDCSTPESLSLAGAVAAIISTAAVLFANSSLASNTKLLMASMFGSLRPMLSFVLSALPARVLQVRIVTQSALLRPPPPPPPPPPPVSSGAGTPGLQLSVQGRDWEPASDVRGGLNLASSPVLGPGAGPGAGLSLWKAW